jgi:hypothetical protein
MSTLEKIEQMAHDVSIAVQASQKALGSQEIMAQRVLGFEQASASLGKIVSALTKVLIESGVTTDQQIYKAILKVEEEQDRREVEMALKHDYVEAAEVVTDSSIVVVSQEVVGEPDSKLDYRLYKLMDGSAPTTFIQDIMGRKIGETLMINMAEEKVLSLIVKEIYTLKQQAEA